MMTLQSVAYKEGDYYVAQCLDVDVSSFGTSQEEALSNLAEAVELYLEDEPTAKDIVSPVENPSIHMLHLSHA